ncbi:MAG TPA: GTPase RsgA, partial [Xanthomonadaceae bacterium]|nr:GTPase RsgA [Xanthomonadaceae bacterium]
MTPLRAIGWPHAGPVTDPQWAACLAAHPQARPARVVEQHRTGYVVAEGPDAGAAAESPPEWQRASGYRKGRLAPEERAAVGDWVLVEGSGRSAKIVALLPRHTAIKRAAAGEHYKQQLIAANV